MIILKNDISDNPKNDNSKMIKKMILLKNDNSTYWWKGMKQKKKEWNLYEW